MSVLWIDGRFGSAEKTRLPSIEKGDGLFETILVRDARAVLLEAHVDRLLGSARVLSIPGIPDREEVLSACRALAEGAGSGRSRLRLVLDRGSVAATVERFGGYPPEIYEKGVSASVARRAGHPLKERAGHKVIPYTPLMRLRREARNRGAFEMIFRDRDGALLEGCASNLFLVLDGGLVTPPLSRPILPGVVRARVLEIARESGLGVVEGDLALEDLTAAREAFLTGSLMEIVPLHRLGRVWLRPGPLARLLLARLREEATGD